MTEPDDAMLEEMTKPDAPPLSRADISKALDTARVAIESPPSMTAEDMERERKREQTKGMFPFVPPPPVVADAAPVVEEAPTVPPPPSSFVTPPSVTFGRLEPAQPLTHDHAVAQVVEFDEFGISVPPDLGFEQTGIFMRATTRDRVREAFKAKSIDVLPDGRVRVVESGGAWFTVTSAKAPFVAG